MPVYNYVNTKPYNITISGTTIPGLSEIQSTSFIPNIYYNRGKGVDVYINSNLAPPDYAIQNPDTLGITSTLGHGLILDTYTWYIQPSSYAGSPRSDGTLGDVSSSKDRVAQFAGMPYPIVVSGTSKFGGNLQWGSATTAEANYPGSATDTAYLSTPSNIESSANAWLKFKDNNDGTQEYAMGRVVKYQDGRLRFRQGATDALVSGCPRVQWFTSPLIPKIAKYSFILSPQFGDATTPWPAYVANKDDVLWMQVKGSASQPIISATVRYDSPTSETLTVRVNVKPTNAGTITTIASISGLAKDVRHDFVIEGTLEFDSTGYWNVWYNNEIVGTYSGNTMMTDFADNVQLMQGIYRFGWTTKAPDDCAITFHKSGILISSK